MLAVEFWNKWQQAASSLDSTPPSEEALTAVTELLAHLLNCQQNPLHTEQRLSGPSPVAGICAVDMNSDGCAEIFVAYQNGRIHYYPDPLAQPNTCLTTNLENADHHRILGLASRTGWWGRPQVGVVTTKPTVEDNLVLYDLVLSDGTTPTLNLTVGQSLPITHPPVTWPIWAGQQRQKFRLEIIAVTGPDQPIYRLLAVDQSASGWDGEWTCPFRPLAVVQTDTAIYIAGARTRLIRLIWSDESHPSLIADPSWSAETDFFTTCLMARPQPNGAFHLLVGSDDGRLIALDGRSGALIWSANLPGIATALSFGDLDKDGQTEILVGYEDGTLDVFTDRMPAADQVALEQLVNTAVSWAFQISEPLALVNQYLHDGRSELNDWAVRWLADNRHDKTALKLAAEILQSEPILASHLLARWCQTHPDPAVAFQIANWLSGLKIPVKPAVLRWIDRLRGMATPYDLDLSAADPTHLIAAWIDAQHGVHCLWRLPLPAPIVTLQPVVDEAAGTTWLWLGTTSGQVIQMDLGQREQSGQWQLPAPLRQLGPTPDGIRGAETTVCGLSTDGAFYQFVPGNNPIQLARWQREGWAWHSAGSDLSLSLDESPRQHDGQLMPAFTSLSPEVELVVLLTKNGRTAYQVTARRFALQATFQSVTGSDLLTIKLPARIVQLLAWPDAQGNSYLTILCSNQRLYCFNHAGELLWQRFPGASDLNLGATVYAARGTDFALPTATLFDLDGDGRSDLFVAVADRVVVYDLLGGRLGEFRLEAHIHHLASFRLLTARKEAIPAVAAVTTQGELLVFQLLDYKTAAQTAAQAITHQWETKVAGADPIRYWQTAVANPADDGLAEMGLLRLSHLAIAGDAETAKRAAAALGAVPISLTTTPDYQILLVRALVRAAAYHADLALFDSLHHLLQFGSNRQFLAQALIMTLEETAVAAQVIEQTLPPPWRSILKVGATCDDETVRHGLGCLVAEQLIQPRRPHDGWWEVLQWLILPSDPSAHQARKAIAHRLLDLYRQDKGRAWEIAHEFCNRAVDPLILQPIFSADLPLLCRDEVTQRLFASVYTFLTHDSHEAQLAALHQLDTEFSLDETWFAVHHAQIYHHLAVLANLRTAQDLETFFSGGNWSDLFAGYFTEATNTRTAFSTHVGPVLEKSLLLMRRGLDDVLYVSMEESLEGLRLLLTNLDLQRSQVTKSAALEQQAGRLVNTAWLKGLNHVLADWSQILSSWLRRLTNEFIWEVQLLNPRFRDDELRVNFEIRNKGLATGFKIQLEPPHLTINGRSIPCTVQHNWTDETPNLAPNQSMNGLIRATYLQTPGESDYQNVDAILFFTLQFTTDEREPSSQSVAFNLPSRQKTIDYPRSFPTSWKHYSNRMRQILGLQGGLLLLELDRSARHTFFEGCLSWVKPGDGRIVNLQRILSHLRQQKSGEGQAIRLLPSRLHDEIATAAMQMDKPFGFEASYRREFFQALHRGSRPVTTLFLEHFDYLLLNLIESEDGRATLSETLTFWQELAEQNHLHLVLGCSYLTHKILQAEYPAFSAACQVLRPNYLLETDESWAESTAFLRQQFQDRQLTTTVNVFSQPITPEEMARLCGNNLMFMRSLLLEGLEQARRETLDPTNQRDFSATSLTQYLLEYGRQKQFFRNAWVWLSFYEKLLLTLVAYAEFSVENKAWLDTLQDLRLSRPYRPGAPRGRPRRTEAQTGEPLTDVLAGKIRSSRYFSPHDVWLAGLATRRALVFGAEELDRVGQMLLRLLRAVDLERLLAEMAANFSFNERESHREIGKVYTFRIPIWREFYLRNKPFLYMVRAALGSEMSGDTAWYPPELHLHSYTLQPLFQARAQISPVYRSVPLTDLKNIDQAFSDSKEDRNLFLNFYGMSSQRQQQWRYTIGFVEGLTRFCYQPGIPSESEIQHVFSQFNFLLNLERAASPWQLRSEQRWTAYGDGGVIWQVTSFGDRVIPGLAKHFIIGLVRDSRQWKLWADNLSRDATRFSEQLKALEMNGEKEVNGPNVSPDHKPDIVILITPDGATGLRQAVEQSDSGYAVEYVFIEGPDLGEIITAVSPNKHLIRLCQRQVGRALLAPFQTRGPLSPGSRLFVGRQRQIQRILQVIDRSPSLIFGSRRIGKTSLLHQIQGRLLQHPHYFPLWISGSGAKTDEDFFAQVGSALARSDYPELADWLGAGQEGYHGLRRVLYAFRDEKRPFPILLLDEVDSLYLEDKKNGEPLFNLLRDLTQTSPPLCGLVMTGYRDIYFQRYDHGSVFFNFGEPVFLREVKEAELAQLISLLEDYEVEFYNRQDAINRLLQGTYCIPYLVQTACLQLLRRLDRPNRTNPNRIDIEDIEIVLAQQIDTELIDELIRKIRVEANSRASAEELQLRLRIVLYAITLHKYWDAVNNDGPFHPLASGEQTFTTNDVLVYLETWAGKVKPAWPWTFEEIDSILQELRMTLAISAGHDLEERSYYFPQDIVPRLLHRWYQKEQRRSILDDLEDDINLYLHLKSSL